MNDSQKAIEILGAGGIVIYPTDTAFGIGCRIGDHEAVDRLFKIRRRPLTQAMPVLVDSIDMALTCLESPSEIVRRFMKLYWPGALTIVAPCKKNRIYSPIRGYGETIGLRMPGHPTIVDIITRVGEPILGPSANFHGDPTPYSTGDLNRDLIRLVDYVVPGDCTVRQASTVVDCSTDPYKILRKGAIEI